MSVEVTQPLTRSARLKTITDLIDVKRIRSQRELAQELSKAGFEVAQPTLSRDLEDLSVAKDKSGFYVLPSSNNSSDLNLRRNLKELLISANRSQQLVILKTPPGGAHLLAGALDQAKFPDVLGTIAGDDTVLVITADENSGLKFLTSILDLVESRK